MEESQKAKRCQLFKNICLILVGCFILAVADVLFIVPCNIVNGGLDSLAVILNYFFSDDLGFNISDIVIAVFQVALWFLGLALLGKRFSFYTLVGSFAFPALYSLLLRLDFAGAIGITAFYEAHMGADGNLDFSVLLAAALFGGGLTGVGVALTYLGDGSTGGSDVLSFLLAKYTSLKQDFGGLILDTTMIFIGFACLQSWSLFFAGVISAVVAAFAIRLVYVQNDNPVIMDIICKEPAPVMDFIHTKLGHATSLLEIEGGYTGLKKTMVRAIVYGSETKDVLAFVSSVDPDAFITSAKASNISGEGFEPLRVSPRSLKRLLHKYGIKTYDDNKREREGSSFQDDNK